MPGHDIIVLGGSAGGLETLMQAVRGLPTDLPAALFVAMHTVPYAPSHLPQILSRTGPLGAIHPRDGEAIQPGRIYVAPPDHHLLVRPEMVRVVQGPRENNCRPAIDPLFRTAAHAYGPRVVGVVLSGILDDGTAGLAAIKEQGGVAIVQDPDDALFPSMPRNALDDVDVDFCLPAAQIASVLTRLVHTPPAEENRVRPMSSTMETESAMEEFDLKSLQSPERPGTPSPFVCPNCGGDLWELREGKLIRFRCRIGHAWAPLSLLAGQTEALEETLSEAFRALKEKSHLEQRMTARARERGDPQAVAYYEKQAANAERYATAIREMLLNLKAIASEPPPSADPPSPATGEPAGAGQAPDG